MADTFQDPIATASLNWFDSSGQLHIRVYVSDGYNVIERCADGNGWTDGTLNVPGTQISATCWTASDGTHIRVYATSDDGTVEWCQNPGSTSWTQGAFTIG
ncbi:MAG: fucose-binding lectin protein [Sphingomonadales bacterium]|nr:fucose-binding lectin protein [Sphingomonadales bacterium]MBD3772962.1 fucose-binding lectin protein [Paracoccaceae bacterium]